MNWPYNRKYPSIEDLHKKASKRIPKFAMDYLDGGCNEDVNLYKNTSELRQIELQPQYLSDYKGCSLKKELFGQIYEAPFGIAPVGLQGLIWPNASSILAKAAHDHNIPFILSTVTTSSIEAVSEITEGKAWFQLYHPSENDMRDSILQRLNNASYPVLVLLCDVPSFGYRPRDIRNGLSMPPRLNTKSLLQIMARPSWAYQTLLQGQPQFATLKEYMPSRMNMRQLGEFMNRTFSGRLNKDKISAIRDKWKGKLVLKGVASEADTELAIQLGFDGIIVSNHGGRQIDAGQSAITSLINITEKYRHKITIMMDSGVRSGPDIARAIAAGADFVFLGRSFMYGVAALGKEGGTHTISILKNQLQQVMEQVCCDQITDLPDHIVKKQPL